MPTKGMSQGSRALMPQGNELTLETAIARGVDMKPPEL
jgi:hypothetical protein